MPRVVRVYTQHGQSAEKKKLCGCTTSDMQIQNETLLITALPTLVYSMTLRREIVSFGCAQSSSPWCMSPGGSAFSNAGQGMCDMPIIIFNTGYQYLHTHEVVAGFVLCLGSVDDR